MKKKPRYFTEEELSIVRKFGDEMYELTAEKLLEILNTSSRKFMNYTRKQIDKRIAKILERYEEITQDLLNSPDISEEGKKSLTPDLMLKMSLVRLIQDRLIFAEATVNDGRVTLGIVGGANNDEDIVATFYLDGDPKMWVDTDMYMTVAEAEDNLDMLNKIYKDNCHTTTVNFPTGEVCFSNFFHMDSNKVDDLPDDIQYAQEYCINNTSGVQRTMEWLAENRGIAYGQLGNMSYGVHVISEDEIHLTTQWLDCYYDSETDEEKDYPKMPPVESSGEVSCEVWRFEAVDKQSLKDHDFDLEAFKAENRCDFVDVKVNPGEWKVEVFYKHMSEEEMVEKWGYPIYARLTRNTDET